jgi:hypothetical protein
MSGNPDVVWLCLLAGMLLQLTYMVLPFEPRDWARYLGAALVIGLTLAFSYEKSHAIKPAEGLFFCGLFAFVFAFIFQARILPRLGEGLVLTWSLVLLYVLLELGVWRAATPYIVAGSVAAALALMALRDLRYLLKLAVYAWFLVTIVALGILQFRGSDFSLIMAGKTGQVEYGFAFIDGMAGAYIAVHATFLYELLPIPERGEGWDDFTTRWLGYLDMVAKRVDGQRLSTYAALGLIGGIVLLTGLNHVFDLLPARTLANLLLVGLPMGWSVASGRRFQRQGANEAQV